MVTIEAHELSKSYRSSIALQAVTFSAEPGTLTALVGPNGAGKTTLMKRMTEIISGGGETTYDGSQWATIPYPRRVVGLYLGSWPFHSTIRTEDHLRLVASTIPGIPASRINETLEHWGLGTHRDKRVARLSMGLRQRLGIATAMLPNPPVLLLDEPFSALDPTEATEVYDWLSSVAHHEGRTVVLSTHHLDRIEPHATHALSPSF